jgi:tetratricopeptide (TPR) repeat protein
MQVTTHLDSSLRERADDPDELREALESEASDLRSVRQALADSPNELDVTRLARILNRLADHLRLDGRFEEAVEHATQARDIWQDLDRRRAAYLAELRRVHALGDMMDDPDAWARGCSACDTLVHEADADDELEIYLDFALERRGIIGWRLDGPDGALDDLEAALRIRRERGIARLVDRTETIIEHVQSNA